MYAARDNAGRNRDHIPVGAIAYLGLFTGSGSIHRLAYGYRIPGCHPVYTLDPPTPYPTDCIGWEVLDANTAEDLEMTWEGLSQ
jgi:hypothetical protein